MFWCIYYPTYNTVGLFELKQQIDSIFVNNTFKLIYHHNIGRLKYLINLNRCELFISYELDKYKLQLLHIYSYPYYRGMRCIHGNMNCIVRVFLSIRQVYVEDHEFCYVESMEGLMLKVCK